MTISMVSNKINDDRIFGFNLIIPETVEYFLKTGGSINFVAKSKRGRKSLNIKKAVLKHLGLNVNRVKGKFTSNFNKKVWEIRKNAAKKFDCGVMEISWAACCLLVK